MSIKNTITFTGVDPASKKTLTTRGTADTRAEALAEAQARLALTVMTDVKGRESQALPDADMADSTPADGESADGVIVLSKGVGYSDKTLRIDNITTAVLKAGTKGKIDGSHALIAAMVSAYRDGDGVGGYVFLDGDLYP